jgi:hypothetical protein
MRLAQAAVSVRPHPAHDLRHHPALLPAAKQVTKALGNW